VISFDNQTGDKTFDYLKKAIPNLLISSLEQSKYLRVTTWERMDDLLRQMGKAGSETIDKESGFELCRKDGVETIVVGSFVKAEDMFVTDVKVLDVDSKALLKSASSQGEGVRSILEKQIGELSREISRGVGLSERKIQAARPSAPDVPTSSMDAYNSFLKGKEAYEKFYYEQSRQLLENAVALDADFAEAYLYLARTQSNLGNQKARVEAYEKAKVLSGKAAETNEGYRVPHGFLRGRSYHRPPQAHLCCGEAPAVSGRLAGALDGRGSPGRIFLIKFSYAEGGVRVISGSSGSADGFQVVRPRSPGVIDMFPALIYASLRWRDGIIDAKTRPQPAQQKTKYLWGLWGRPRVGGGPGEWWPRSNGIMTSCSRASASS